MPKSTFALCYRTHATYGRFTPHLQEITLLSEIPSFKPPHTASEAALHKKLFGLYKLQL